MGSVHFLYPDQVPDSMDHAPELRAVRLHDGLADAVQAQRPQRAALLAVPADLRLDLGHLELRHLVCPLAYALAPVVAAARAASIAFGATCSIVRPRLAAISSGRLRPFRAATVACT